jgi:hypothetical protein
MPTFLYMALDNFLSHPPENDTVELQQDHWCSSQSQALYATGLQIRLLFGLTY